MRQFNSVLFNIAFGDVYDLVVPKYDPISTGFKISTANRIFKLYELYNE